MDNQKKTFYCVDCHHVFMAFENDSTVCPKCHSDNIRLQSKVKSSSLWPKIGVAVAAALIGFFATKGFMVDGTGTAGCGTEGATAYVGSQATLANNGAISANIGSQQTTPQSPAQATEGTGDETSELEQVSDGKADDIPQTIEETITSTFTTPTHVDYIYSFQAKCNLDGKERLMYELMETRDGDVIQNCTDGKFKDLKPRKTGYYFRVRVLKTNQLSEAKLVTGFNSKPAMIEQKMTVEELESLINGQKASTDKSGKIAKGLVIKFTNKTSEDDYNNLQDVENELLFNNWSSVKVASVEYNERGQISKVTLTIVK